VALTASIVTNPTKPYDGNTNATLSSANFALSGLIAGESFTITKNSGTYNSKTWRPRRPSLRVCQPAISRQLRAHWRATTLFPPRPSGPGQITPKALTASIIGNPTKGYDQTTAATLIPSKLLAVRAHRRRVVHGNEEFRHIQLQGCGDRDDRHCESVSQRFTAAAGTLASNYTLPTAASGPGKITPRPLTVSAHGVDKQYDNTTARDSNAVD